jgi:hypothetical protein
VTDPVVLINVFEVPAADAEQFIAAWEKTRDYLLRYPAEDISDMTPDGVQHVLHKPVWTPMESVMSCAFMSWNTSVVRRGPGNGRNGRLKERRCTSHEFTRFCTDNRVRASLGRTGLTPPPRASLPT